MFAPYSYENTYYFPGTKLALFVLIDNAVTDIERIEEGLQRIGTWGYGRDASIGMGRFAVERADELEISESNEESGLADLALGNHFYGDRKLADERRHYEEAFKREPGHPMIANNLAMVLLAQDAGH